MARERAKLTDKQERILVQAQLMGLTPRDMTQISNRLVAIQKEAADKLEIQSVIEGYSWVKNDKNSWTITTPEGYVCKFGKSSSGKGYYWETVRDYPITVIKPGTAFKARVLQKKQVSFKDNWRAKFCPENSKELYGMIKWLGHHLQYELRKK
jgi:hypothetical protein